MPRHYRFRPAVHTGGIDIEIWECSSPHQPAENTFHCCSTAAEATNAQFHGERPRTSFMLFLRGVEEDLFATELPYHTNVEGKRWMTKPGNITTLYMFIVAYRAPVNLSQQYILVRIVVGGCYYYWKCLKHQGPPMKRQFTRHARLHQDPTQTLLTSPCRQHWHCRRRLS